MATSKNSDLLVSKDKELSYTLSCSIYQACKICIVSEKGNFCSFCHEMCNKAESQVIDIIYSSDEKCSCNHEENSEFFKKNIIDAFKELPHLSVSKINALNAFLSHRINGQSVFELADPEVAGLYAKDFKALMNQTFKWDDIPIPSIEQRAIYANYFNQSDAKILITNLNTAPLEQLFPLKFINLITDCPDYSFGQPIYNQSLNFYTYLLDFFIRYYLMKDLKNLDKIDAQDIETYSPLARNSIRMKNQNNPFIRLKYFNEQFDVHRFALKLVEKFVPGATWRWIGGNHKAHVYSIKICKLLIEYGLLDEAQCEEIKHALYLKIPVYRSLETIIDRDASNISEYWVNIWYDGLKAIREYYCEILINYLYMKKDNEVFGLMQKLIVQKENNEEITLNFLRKNISFDQSIFFDESFSKKMLEFIYGYLVSQNTINKKLITTSMKTESIIENFLQQFSNVEDPYLRSLRLLRDQDFENYLAQSKIPISNRIDLTSVSKELLKVRARIIQGAYSYKESQLIKDLEQILDLLNEKLDYEEGLKSAPSHKIYNGQKALFNHDIPMSLELIIASFCNDFKKLNYQSLLNKFCKLIEYYLKDSIEHHSIHLVENNFWNYENLLYVFPEEISAFLLRILKENSQAMYVKEYILDVILCIFGKQLKLDNKNETYYKCLINLLNILVLHHQEQYEKIFDWIPEYDVRITMDLVTYPEIFQADEIERLLPLYTNSGSLDDLKLEYLITLLKLLQKSTNFRFVETSYKKINEAYSIDKLAKLINLAGTNIDFRRVLYELYTNFHIDFKDHLMNSRADYYCTKPADMQYEEDPFYDKEFNKTLDLIANEIKWVIEKFSGTDIFVAQKDQFLEYLSETVMVSIVKLINYFTIIKEGDLHKLNKYIQRLEEFSNFLFDNKLRLCEIYGTQLEELDSPERKKLEVQLAKIDENQKIKKEKVLIISHCHFILETCNFIMSQKEIKGYKRKLMNYKTPIERAEYSLKRLRHFSRDINERKANFDLIEEKFQRRINKNVSNPSIISRYLAMSYEQYKLGKMSVDVKNNYYLKSLGLNQETKSFSLNVCHYIHNVLKTEWNIDKKVTKIHLIECLCNMLYANPLAIQDSIYKLVTENNENQKDCPFLDKIWSEMKWSMSYVKFKTNIDKYWKEGFRKVLLIMKFHYFICQGQSKQFKDIFREKTLPSDSIDRVQRWTTVFQRMSDNCEWHYNYIKGEITNFGRPNRPYLIPLSIEVFDNLSEVCHKNFDNKNKVYTYIYDRYNGILKRFVKDPNSQFYHMKLALIRFILVMTETMNQDILNYQITNFELTNINTIIINSVKQLYYSVVKNDKMEASKKLSDYLLKVKDFEYLAKAFETSTLFSKHILLQICKTLFLYILKLKEVRLKYENFCKEREDMIIVFKKTKQLSNKYISEEDFVSFMFLSEVVCKDYYEGKKIHISKGRSVSEEGGLRRIFEEESLKEKNKGISGKIDALDISVNSIQTEINSKTKQLKEEVKEEIVNLSSKIDAHKEERKEENERLKEEIAGLKTEIGALKEIILGLNGTIKGFLDNQNAGPSDK